MIPDFSKNTSDTLAKRAAYLCSNPDCRVSTIGPNSESDKAISIGEAAHIYGARVGSKRFKTEMNDSSRGEITNGIWLCRNCHKLIDTDDQKYSSNLLFSWRAKHDEYVSSTLGNNTEKINYEQSTLALKEFNEYTPIIKRIVIDKPDCWEYRLTAELMKYLNEPLYRRLKDLKEGLYLKPIENIEGDKAFRWIQERLAELTRIVKPAVGLLDKLTKSWGIPGEPGNEKEIHHVTKLIKEYLQHVVAFEERMHFVNVPTKYLGAVKLLTNLIGSQIEKFEKIPYDLEEIVLLSKQMQVENTPFQTIRKEIVFELPEYWEREFNEELERISNGQTSNKTGNNGCLSLFIFLTIMLFWILH